MAPGADGSSLDVPLNGCRRCNRITQSGPKCIICGVITHAGCLKYLKQVKIISEKEINCCVGDCDVDEVLKSQSTLATVSTDVKDLEIAYLRQLLEQKDVIIENQADLIKALKDQVLFLKGGFNDNGKFFPPKETAAETSTLVSGGVAGAAAGGVPGMVTSSVKSTVNKRKPAQRSNNGAPQNEMITIQAVQEAVAKAKCDNIINLGQGVVKPQYGVSGGSKPYRRKNEPIIGDRPVDSQCTLRAATSFTHWHVYRLHPDTRAGDVVDYLKVDFPGVSVEALKSANPALYSSFKVTVEAKDGSRVSEPGLWPCGTRINRFFLSRDKNKS